MEETPVLREPISQPGEPTTAAPGSPRKIRVLMERATRREPLFNPRDGLRGRLASELSPEDLAELQALDLEDEADEEPGEFADASTFEGAH
jgi:hypothetical protein